MAEAHIEFASKDKFHIWKPRAEPFQYFYLSSLPLLQRKKQPPKKEFVGGASPSFPTNSLINLYLLPTTSTTTLSR